jgi:hypothetical protein
MHRSIAILLLLSCPAVALAQEKPPITPQRDVDITYTMAQPIQGGPPLSQRMRWSVAAGKLRVDPPSPGLYMIVDYHAKRMAVVKDSERAVLDLNAAAPGLPGAPSGAAFTRGSVDQAAGLACTNWQTTDARGHPTQICITADGVLLRASEDGHTLLEATRVAYGAQDPAAFLPPDGYRHITPVPNTP